MFLHYYTAVTQYLSHTPCNDWCSNENCGILSSGFLCSLSAYLKFTFIVIWKSNFDVFTTVHILCQFHQNLCNPYYFTFGRYGSLIIGDRFMPEREFQKICQLEKSGSMFQVYKSILSVDIYFFSYRVFNISIKLSSEKNKHSLELIGATYITQVLWPLSWPCQTNVCGPSIPVGRYFVAMAFLWKILREIIGEKSQESFIKYQVKHLLHGITRYSRTHLHWTLFIWKIA
jgi:hypothetical protein